MAIRRLLLLMWIIIHSAGEMIPNLFGTEDIDRNGNGIFNAGDAIQIVTTDCWDDSNPTWAIHENCQ